MEVSFSFIQEMVKLMSGMEVRFASTAPQELPQLADQVAVQAPLPHRVQRALEHQLQRLLPGCIYELSNPLGLQYTLLRIDDSSRLLVLGPCRQETFLISDAQRYLRRLDMTEQARKQILDYCQHQPVVTYELLHSLAVLLGQQLLHTTGPLPYQSLEPQWEEGEQTLLDMSSFTEISQLQQIEDRYESNTALLLAVQQGNLSLAFRILHTMERYENDFNRNPDALRNTQNLCIILNTQLRQTLQDSGIHPYELDRLSGEIGRGIEKIKSMSATRTFMSQMISRYCQLAQQPHLKNLSPFVRLAVSYIHTHLSDNISVQDTAKTLVTNPDYLSAQFHREVGVPFIYYVNQQRTLQAAALLRRTEMQIQQVASVVGYNNASYFSRQFVTHQGLTPRAYRSQCRAK